MITDPIDTLAYHQSRVLTSHRDMSGLPVASVVQAMKSFPTAASTIPEREAIYFYGLNHGMALISSRYAALEPLPKYELDYVNRYYALMNEKAVRAFYYLLVICTRESRHNKSLHSDKPQIEQQFGKAIANFHVSVSGGEAGIYQKLLTSPPDATIGAYCESLRWCFYNSKWNGGYGGKAWGQVTDCLVRFVNGTYTAEVMLDTIWTLCHNNGPIFNKGVYYSMYSPVLRRILDVQRSGQVPEAILGDDSIRHFAPHDLIGSMISLSEVYSDAGLGTYVNWYKVEALGSIGKYPAEKQAQIAKYGMTPELEKTISEAEKAAVAKKIAAQLEAKKAAEALAEMKKNSIEIMPGVLVPKVQMARAA